MLPTMKPVMPLIILTTLSALSSLTIAEPIYDTNGEEVYPAQAYHILPADRGLDAGIDLDFLTGSYPCPRRVVVRHGDQPGIPVRITPAIPDSPLRLSDDVEVDFYNPKLVADCQEVPKQWHLRFQESEDMQWHVAAGRMDRFGTYPQSAKVFRIERHHGAPEGYKLVSCAGWPDNQKCHDLGLHVDAHGEMWLVVSNTPFVVVFQKYTGTK